MNSQNRICPIEENQLFEEALREIDRSFGETWLNSDSGHPLQTLWRRRDVLSSIELFTLGSSLIRIKSINPYHFMEYIDIIKKSDRNGSHGAVNGRRGTIFEVVLAAALHNPPEQIIELLDPQYPVYDMIVHLIDKTSINISVKNFGQSEKDELFIKEAKLVEQVIRDHLRQHGGIFIRSDIYPSAYHWDELLRKLPNILRNPIWECENIRDNWHIYLSPLASGENKLYTGELSYTFFVTAPFYKNEVIRLYSKLNEACRDLEQRGKRECNKSANILYAHLPAYILMDDYCEWCNKYLSENPNVPISSIRLIQPAYAKNSEEDTTSLFILYKDISRCDKESIGFTSNGKRLINRFPVGQTAGRPFELTFGGTNAKLPKMHYWYQSGQIYLFDEVTEGCNIKHNLRYDYGIHTHSVIRIKGEDLIVSANSPPTYELLLL